MSSHLMILPSLACPADCAYCFGPHQDGPSMRRETLEAVVHWQKTLGQSAQSEEPLDLTFHGGEPLVPGVEFYRMVLPLLRDGLDPRQVRFSVQSNLWLLTDELCELFREHAVSVGTSLDGPEPINDAQRGMGYFRRTMAGIERARTHGLNVGCICTFTSRSVPYADEVFDFFVREGLSFSIHAALPPHIHPRTSSLDFGGLPDCGTNGWSLSPDAHGQLLTDMLERYLSNLQKVRISTLDAICRSVSAGHGGVCTFGDCLGNYLAVDPTGWVYPCQRFAGISEYRLGNVYDVPSQETLAASPVRRAFQTRQERIKNDCGDCPHLEFCRGGCPYNMLAADGGDLTRFETRGIDLRDPHCPAYKRAFSHVTDQALKEVFSEENLAVVVEEGPGKYGLLRKGRLLQIMRDGPHPQKVARRARELVAAVALAVSESPEEALCKLDRAGLITRPELALQSLTALRHRLDTQSQQGLVNAYIHVTYTCNLRCTHCYARSGPEQVGSLSCEDTVRLVCQLAEAGFRKAIITGGEPLLHPQHDALLDGLADLHREVKPLQTVLRTNLSCPLTPELMERLSHSTDQVVVSVDGDEASHDARRGNGTYASTVANLRTLVTAIGPSSPKHRGKQGSFSPGGEKAGMRGEGRGVTLNNYASPGQVVIAATLTADQMRGLEGESVRILGEELGVPVRFKPVLPLGRGTSLRLTPAFYNSLDDDAEAVACAASPAATCGLGMNLYVGPDGECFPCYAMMRPRHYLGKPLDDGLPSVLARNQTYRRVTVDSNRQCRDCLLRYLCGGFCRAWGSNNDPDAPPSDCAALHDRSRGLLVNALESLEVDVKQWLAANLPLPEASLKKGRIRNVTL